MTDIFNTYRSGLVRRYHANPDFAHIGQTNAAHQWGVAVLVRLLHPRPSADLITAAMTHDVGEMWAGDLSHPFKVAHPEISGAHQSIEYQHRHDALGFTPILNFTDFEWLSLCDRLEAYLFAAEHKPAVLKRDDWRRDRASIAKMAKRLKREGKVMALVRRAEGTV